MKIKGCSCKKFKKSIDQIRGAQIFAHTHGWNYTGYVFKFCPFCGKKLKTTGKTLRNYIKENYIPIEIQYRMATTDLNTKYRQKGGDLRDE